MENDRQKRIMVTGGLGFIGSCFVEMAMKRGFYVINVDKMTYAIREDTDFEKYPNYRFIKKDICDLTALPENISFIINFAAESHVDNSIAESEAFFRSNVYGVYNLLELVRKLPPEERPIFSQISTDEVYGDILEGTFSETDRLNPSNPYSATKAAADQLVFGFGRTYGLRWRMSRSSNCYGYGQRPEKLIPRAMKWPKKGWKVPVHGSGSQRREWIHTEDKCAGIFLIMEKGSDGEIYNLSTGEEYSVLEVVKKVLKVMNFPEDMIEFTADRPGQDLRYAINSEKIRELGWKPKMTLDQYLPICKHLNEERTRNMPPGRKKRLLQFLGLENLLQ